MTDVVMGNTVPLKKRIRELETEVNRLRALLADLQRPLTKKSYFQDDDEGDLNIKHIMFGG